MVSIFTFFIMERDSIRLISLLLLLIALPLQGQFGPGGVGYENDSEPGQPELVLWLRADELRLSDGSRINTWYDLSGNGHDAVKGDPDGPVFLEGGLKGAPCVQFSGGEWFKVEEKTNLDGGPGITAFVVMQPQAIDGGAGMKLITKRNHWNLWGGGLSKETCQYSFNLDFHGREESQYVMAHVNGNLPDNKVETGAIYGDTSQVYLVNYNYTGSVSAIRVNGENTQDAKPNPNTNVEGTGPLEDYDNDVTIGAGKYEPQLEGDPGPVGDFLVGNMGEMILYRCGLDTTEMVIVENYLAAKYQLEIGSFLRYSDTICRSNLLAVGSHNGTDIHYASSNGIVTLEAAEGAIDSAGQFFWMADNGVEIHWVDTDLPAGWQERWSRIWKIEPTGNTDLEMTINFIEAGVVLNKNNEFTLLYRATPDEPFEPTGLQGRARFGALQFNWTGSGLREGYYTVAQRAPSTGVHQNLSTSTDFRVYPNPSNGQVTVLNPGHLATLGMRLLDMSGREVHGIYPASLPENTASFTLNLTAPRGYYLLELEHSGGRTCVKCLIE